MLLQTERLPRHFVSVCADLVPQVAACLTDISIAMRDDSEGKKMLKKTDRTTMIDRLAGDQEGLRKWLLPSFLCSNRVGFP